MPLVGEAHILVRADLSNLGKDFQTGFDKGAAVFFTGGGKMRDQFDKGFNKSDANTTFGKFADGLDNLDDKFSKAATNFNRLVQTGYATGTALTTAVGAVSSLIGGLGSLIGVAGGAAASLSSLGSIVTALGLGMGVAKLALSGVGAALSVL
jgi:hypothetical protein